MSAAVHLTQTVGGLTVSDAIHLHHQAVLVDEASFDDNGKAIDEKHAEATLEAEIKAYLDMIAAPCRSNLDVQAKLAYILDGTVGERETLLSCLTIDEYCGDEGPGRLLRSMVFAEGCYDGR